jgi:hypothetical protein
MTELVTDCPRCGSNRITFDLLSSIETVEKHGWQIWYEVFGRCRQCARTTIFVLSERHDGNYQYVHQKGLLNIKSAINQYVTVEGIVSLKDRVLEKAPEHVPENILLVFDEGATCLSVNCYNAAGTMFRLCIDLVTRNLLPEDEIEGLNHRTRRNLGLRLPWLFDNGHLPDALRELSLCVREDGNDGAHAGNLSKTDAEDLLDFSRVLLERIFTEPERLRIAQLRRQQRRDENA